MKTKNKQEKEKKLVINGYSKELKGGKK